MIFSRLFDTYLAKPRQNRRRSRDAAISLYETIVDQSRMPEFYTKLGAPDSVEGRFELLTLHMYLVLRKLKGGGPQEKEFSQTLFDVFFQNMDDSLREMGVGDLVVGRKVRAMAEAFYGRMGAYEAALSADPDNDDTEKTRTHGLQQAIARNVFAAETAPGARAMAIYVEAANARLGEQPSSALMMGQIEFPSLDETAATEHAPA